MKPWRFFAAAIWVTLFLCSLILLQRHRRAIDRETQVRNILARANAGLEGTVDRDEFLRTNGAAVSQVGDALAGVNDYLWVESELLRGSKDVHVPVDAQVQKIVFGVIGTLKKPEWTLKDPDGHVIGIRQTSGLRIELAQGALESIARPDVGTWTLHVAADDNIVLFARAVSNSGMDSCEMKSDHRLHVRLSAEGLSEAQFRIVSKEGFPLSSWLITPAPSVRSSGVPGRGQYEYALEVPKVSGPFRLLVRIQDLQRHDLQRICDSLIETAQS